MSWQSVGTISGTVEAVNSAEWIFTEAIASVGVPVLKISHSYRPNKLPRGLICIASPSGSGVRSLFGVRRLWAKPEADIIAFPMAKRADILPSFAVGVRFSKRVGCVGWSVAIAQWVSESGSEVDDFFLRVSAEDLVDSGKDLVIRAEDW